MRPEPPEPQRASALRASEKRVGRLRNPNSPKISIGLPVFDGEQYLDGAIESIVSQTYPDFELIVADNCSSDASLAIARRWQERDRRIRVIESAVNLGAAPNFNRVFAEARGKFFKWAACDDLIEPEFLQKCIDRMEENPATVLVYSDAMDIDERGDAIGLIYDTEMDMKTDSSDPVLRFRDLVLCNHSCISVFGLIQREALARTGLIDSFVGSDRALLVQLALMGPFSKIAEPLILHREHAGRSTRSVPEPKDRAAWFDTSLSAARVFPHWRLLKEYGLAIVRSEMRLRQRSQCFVHLLRWVRWGGWKNLLDDLR